MLDFQYYCSELGKRGWRTTYEINAILSLVQVGVEVRIVVEICNRKIGSILVAVAVTYSTSKTNFSFNVS